MSFNTRQQLHSIAKILNNHNNIKIYTDGSLKASDTNTIMGIGWTIQDAKGDTITDFKEAQHVPHHQQKQNYWQ